VHADQRNGIVDIRLLHVDVGIEWPVAIHHLGALVHLVEQQVRFRIAAAVTVHYVDLGGALRDEAFDGRVDVIGQQLAGPGILLR